MKPQPSTTTTTPAGADGPPSAKPPSNSKISFILTFLSLLSINLIAAVDSSALSVSLPIIASDLHSTTLEAYWAGTSFVLASAVLVALFPAFSNAFGRKPALLAALVFFTAGTVVAGASGNVTVLIVGRALQGGGSGGLAAM
jgi:MFS family permease